MSYNKPALYASKSCGWSLEYQFLSVQHEPWTSFPSGTSRSVNTGVPNFDHHTRDTTGVYITQRDNVVFYKVVVLIWQLLVLIKQ